jgi:hypothetical protein
MNMYFSNKDATQIYVQILTTGFSKNVVKASKSDQGNLYPCPYSSTQTLKRVYQLTGLYDRPGNLAVYKPANPPISCRKFRQYISQYLSSSPSQYFQDIHIQNYISKSSCMTSHPPGGSSDFFLIVRVIFFDVSVVAGLTLT